jgi:iron complex outermembrane receptor protein
MGFLKCCGLFIFIFVDQFLFAQQVNGVVLDTDKNPVSNTAVQVLNSVQTTRTDDQGEFKLSLPKGTYKLQLSAPGFLIHVEEISVYEENQRIILTLSHSIHEIEEVVITGNKFDESGIQSPLTITAISSDKINATRTWDLNNLVALVPNLQYADLGVSYQQQIAIRGISVFSETPSVSTYIDGVNALDIAANGLQLMDVERIEILRGPQGTLYGRNAMAGVINIITKQPTNATKAFGEASIGNQGLQRYGFGIKTPLVKNKLFFGFSGQYYYQNGYYNNDLSDKTTFLHEPLAGVPEDDVRMGDQASWYGNLFLKYLVSPKLNLTFNSKMQYDHSVGASAYYQAVENNQIALEKPYTFAVNSLGSNSRMVSNNSLAFTVDHSRFRFFSTSSFQYVLQAYNGIDQDLYPYDLGIGSTYRNKLGDPYPQTVFSQEIRFSSPSKASKWQWTTGVYGFVQDYDKQYAAVYEELSLFFGMKPGTQISKTDQFNTGIAAFGNLDYTIREKLTLSAGLRFDYENRKTAVARYYLEDDGTRDYDIPDTLLNSHFNALSPKIALKYVLSKQHMLYASYARGFRAGGNNMFSDAKYSGYLPEYSNNFEIGHKIEFWNRKVRITTSIYYLDWKNMQLDMQPEPGVWIVNNVGKAHSIGLELESTIKPALGMEVDFALGTNNAYYGDFMYLGENIKGNWTILAPVYTLMTGIQQLLPVSKTVNLLLRAEYRSIGKQYFDLVNSIEQPAYHILNSRVGVTYKRIGLFIWGQNLTNSLYLTYAMPGYFKQALVNRPRSMGITLNYNFSAK